MSKRITKQDIEDITYSAESLRNCDKEQIDNYTIRLKNEYITRDGKLCWYCKFVHHHHSDITSIAEQSSGFGWKDGSCRRYSPGRIGTEDDRWYSIKFYDWCGEFERNCIC